MGIDQLPQVVADGVGNWVAVWESNDSLSGAIGTDWDTLVSRSSDDGATWTGVTALNTNATTDSGADRSPKIAADGAGNWLAVWHSSDSLGGTVGTDWDILYISCSPVIPTEDDDCDGWTTADEGFIGTDPNDACADTTTPDDERGPGFGEPLSPSPPDTNDDRFVNITDVNALRPPVFNLLAGKNTIPPNPSYRQRLDMNADTFINITDVNAMRPPIFNLTVPCTP